MCWSDRRLLAGADDARPGGAGGGVARARHRDVADRPAAARRPTADAVETLREAAVAPHAAAGLVVAAAPAAGAVGRPTMTAPRVVVRRHVLLAEGGLGRPRPARAGLAGIGCRPEERVTGARIP